ncbi:response regulator [Chitinibacter fontanus]|uniref:Virulence sensor protein BvgS n=1 Tax=Chitinibacter fontanus TaxID=1737446 RepID=A0A7D5Z6K1_9NEIS|nr:ATP-binding protein [Chitinibacter fontanus]QLI81783.1 response regulator [Chitinibacter fontanus]
MSRRFLLIVLAISTVLLLNFGLIFYFEQQQQAELTHQTEQGMDNQLWQFFQLSSEFQRLREAVNAKDIESTQLRLDIFYSRITGIEQGSTQALFPDSAQRHQLLQPLQQLITESDQTLQAAKLDSVQWSQLQQRLAHQQEHVDLLTQSAREQYAKHTELKKNRLNSLGYFRVALSVLQVVLLLISASLGLWVLWQREKQRRSLVELNASLEEARLAADAATATKSRFLAHISHEIRTPLTSILGYTERLRQNSQLTIQQKNHLSHIAHSGQHLLSLLNHVLDLSKSDSGKLELMPEILSLAQLKLELESMFALMAQEKQLQFEIELAADLPASLLLDAGKLRQILINLIGNSMKFTAQGFIKVALYHSGSGDSCWLYASVSDSGCGIAEHELNHLFHPFEQTASGRHIGGTGLGLALSRDFARLMGGDIEAHSRAGTGSEFTVHVMAKQAPAGELQQEVMRNPVLPSVVGNTILVVEDQAVNRDLLCEILQDAGAKTLAAEDGFTAIAMLETHPEIAQVLMDYQMPGLDGLNTAAALRSKGFQQPIYLVSASPEYELRQHPQFAKVNGYLSKPYQAQELLELLGFRADALALAETDSLPVANDFARAQAQLGFSVERFAALAETGFSRLLDLEHAFIQALDDSDLDTAIRNAHSAKSIAAQLGAMSLAQQWSDLEVTPALGRTQMPQLSELRAQTWASLQQK